MANFPGSWLNFSEYKEIKRLRMAVTETISLRIQITASLIIAIVSAFASGKIDTWPACRQILLICFVCLLVVAVFFGPIFWNRCKFLVTNNVILNGKKAINIFDDEIVYDLMIATEFKKLIENEEKDKSKIKDELKIFYKAEMTYYVKKSMESLGLMAASYTKIFGAGKQQISIERARNINTIINELLKECEPIDEHIKEQYEVYMQNITLL